MNQEILETTLLVIVIAIAQKLPLNIGPTPEEQLIEIFAP